MSGSVTGRSNEESSGTEQLKWEEKVELRRLALSELELAVVCPLERGGTCHWQRGLPWIFWMERCFVRIGNNG